MTTRIRLKNTICGFHFISFSVDSRDGKKSSRITLIVWLMAVAVTTRNPSSAARPFQFHHYQSPPLSLVGPALRLSRPLKILQPVSCWWRRVAHLQRFIFIAYHSNSIQFISPGFPSLFAAGFWFLATSAAYWQLWKHLVDIPLLRDTLSSKQSEDALGGFWFLALGFMANWVKLEGLEFRAISIDA